MESNDPRIIALQEQVSALTEEFDMATTFHEMWKPAAQDGDLHVRMGNSYATQGLLVVRMALRREMVLALTRMWDSNKRALRMKSIPDAIDEPGLMEALAQRCAVHVRMPEVMPAMLADLRRMADELKLLIRKYMDGGTHKAVLDAVLTLRHERLAHRQRAQAQPVPETFDVDVEGFYQDNSRIIALLMHVLKATAYNPADTAKVFETYSRFFWAGARGERTEGHPNFRRPPAVPPPAG